MQDSKTSQQELVLGLFGRESRWPEPVQMATQPRLSDALQGIDVLGRQLRSLQSGASTVWDTAALTLRLDFDGNGAARIAPMGQGRQAELRLNMLSPGSRAAPEPDIACVPRHLEVSGNRARRLRRIVRRVLASRRQKD
jgi:hypothetical protein